MSLFSIYLLGSIFEIVSEIEKLFFKVQKALIESMAQKIPLYKIQIFWIEILIYIQLCHKVYH